MARKHRATSIQMTEETHRKLKRVASLRGKTQAEAIEDALTCLEVIDSVQEILSAKVGTATALKAAKVLASIGDALDGAHQFIVQQNELSVWCASLLEATAVHDAIIKNDTEQLNRHRKSGQLEEVVNAIRKGLLGYDARLEWMEKVLYEGADAVKNTPCPLPFLDDKEGP